jgi:hypothetical protein
METIGDAGFAVRAVEQPPGIERLPLEPLLEAGGGEDGVQLRGEGEALVRG